MTRGEKLRFVRKQRGMTLESLANAIGMSQSYISESENDRSDLSIKTLEKICAALNVNPSFFFGVTETSFESLSSASGKALPDNITDFLFYEDNWPYLQMAKMYAEEGITVEEMIITMKYIKSLKKLKDGKH